MIRMYLCIAYMLHLSHKGSEHMKFKVAILQKRAHKKDSIGNIQLIEENMKIAASQNADILLLPECFLTGYYLPMEQKDALDDTSPYIKAVCEMAKTYHIAIVLTTFTKGIQKPQNTAYIIDKNGRIKMKYSKVHTCDFGDEVMLESGDDFKVCEVEDVTLGVMICYDREYPESARILMLKGAEIILVPNDCCSMQPRIQALSTRAYENMVGIAMANPNGKNAGKSCAYSPICWDKEGTCMDNTLVLADEGSEQLYYALFDMDELRAYRNEEMMGNTYRKTEAYSILLDSTVHEPFKR